MTELPPIDQDAVAAMWADFIRAHPGESRWTADLVAEHYGDSVELADELLALVVAGTKRATAGAVRDYEREGQALPRIGSYWIACDGRGRPAVIQRSVELRIGVIDSVDDAFAWDECEGDRTRDDWLDGHRRYFERTWAAAGETFGPGDLLVFERFVVVWPSEHAD